MWFELLTSQRAYVWTQQDQHLRAHYFPFTLTSRQRLINVFIRKKKEKKTTVKKHKLVELGSNLFYVASYIYTTEMLTYQVPFLSPLS